MLAIYYLSFWSQKRWMRMTLSRKIFVQHRRRFHWLHNRHIKRTWRAEQRRREEAGYATRGQPATRKARRTNGRLRGVQSRMNPRQRYFRRLKMARRRAAREEAA